MMNWLDWWLVNPERWYAHPYTVLWGYLAAGVVTVMPTES